jgi:hypothetical protein
MSVGIVFEVVAHRPTLQALSAFRLRQIQIPPPIRSSAAVAQVSGSGTGRTCHGLLRPSIKLLPMKPVPNPL